MIVIDLLYVGHDLVALIEMASEPDHVLVVNVAVAPAFQGQGFGHALMSHAEEVERPLSFEELRLYTNGCFIENLRLYSELGYQTYCEEVHPQFGAVVYMNKRIKPKR